MEKIAGPIFAIYIIIFEKFLAIFFRMYYYYKYKVVESGGKWGPVGRYGGRVAASASRWFYVQRRVQSYNRCQGASDYAIEIQRTARR